MISQARITAAKDVVSLSHFKSQKEMSQKMQCYSQFLDELSIEELQFEIQYLLSKSNQNSDEEFINMGICILASMKKMLKSRNQIETLDDYINDLSQKFYFLSRKNFSKK